MRRKSLFSAVHLVWEIQMNITIHTRHSAVPARLTEAKRPYRAFLPGLVPWGDKTGLCRAAFPSRFRSKKRQTK